MAELQQGADVAVPTEPEVQEAAATDAAEIARQRIAELSGDAPVSEVATPTEPPVDELTRKFRETQDQVRVLRQQYQNGVLSRDQLQEQLRQYMVLDEDDVWWMMGVESTPGIGFDKAAGDWVVATPPVDLGAAAGPPQAPLTATSGLRAEDVIGAVCLICWKMNRRLMPPPIPEYTSGTEEFYTDPDMPLPRADTPIRDPEYTVPGMAAINQDTVRASEAATFDRGFDAGQTVASQPAYEAAAGYATDDTPSYDTLDDQSDIYQQAVERQRQSTLRPGIAHRYAHRWRAVHHRLGPGALRSRIL